MTHKVLKSCRSKMATLAHDVCDVHGASLLYIKPVGKVCTGFSLLGGWGSPPPTKNLLLHPLLTKFLFPPTIQPNEKIKTSFLAVVIVPVPFLF